MRAIPLVLLLSGCQLLLPVPDGGSGGGGGGGGGGDAGEVTFPAVSCYEGDAGISIWAPVTADVAVPRDLGRILGCQHVRALTPAQIGATPQFTKHNWTADTGIEQFIIQYVSQGPVGKLRKATALLYLPTAGKKPYPVVAVNHGTNGVGPGCGPTHQFNVTDYMAMPLAAHGFAVVAPDYFGMGVDDGISPYGDGDAEAAAILDAVRTIRHFKGDARWDASSLSDELFLFGHSQGGQATLFAHQRYDASIKLRLLGSLTFAPGFGDLRGSNALWGASKPMDLTMTFLTMAYFGAAEYHGAPAPSTWLTPLGQQKLRPLLHDLCFFDAAGGPDLYKSVPATFPTQGDLFTSSFLTAAGNCGFYGTACAGFSPWQGYLEADVPGNFTSTVPALLLQGEKDTVVPPYTMACVANRLFAKGTPVQSCGYASSDHYTLVDDAMTDAIKWMDARRTGMTPNVCPAALSAICL